jgi:ATP-dependent DNA ligase
MPRSDLDRSAFDCKKGDYCVGRANDLADPTLQRRAQEYRRMISGKMRPLSGEDAFKIPKSKGYYVSRKYDGEFSMLVWDGEKLISVNPGGTVRVGLPCYEEAEKLLKKAKVKEGLFAGEIYIMAEVTRAHPVQQVVRILRAPKSVSELDKLGVAIFDIIELEGKPITTTKAVFDKLKKIFGKGKRVHPAEYKVADKPDTIMELFADWVIGEGAEGIVVRHDRAGWFKVKSRHNVDVAVIGYSEGVDERKGLLHDLLVAVVRNDGTFHELARVGGGFTEEDRRIIADEMRRRIVSSDYVAVNNDYVAYEMVHPGPVIEMSCLDLIPESARGGPVNKMVLEFDGKQFNALSRMPLVSVISPQFVRYRDDKEANVEDTNIRQISDLKLIADVAKPARDAELTPSKLLERTVYTKTMRGNRMVRKLLLWKTNKDDGPDFPGYVVYLTDFSPNRMNPLERDIRIAQSERSARRMFHEMAQKNFVGGWEKVA